MDVGLPHIGTDAHAPHAPKGTPHANFALSTHARTYSMTGTRSKTKPAGAPAEEVVEPPDMVRANCRDKYKRAFATFVNGDFADAATTKQHLVNMLRLVEADKVKRLEQAFNQTDIMMSSVEPARQSIAASIMSNSDESSYVKVFQDLLHGRIPAKKVAQDQQALPALVDSESEDDADEDDADEDDGMADPPPAVRQPSSVRDQTSDGEKIENIKLLIQEEKYKKLLRDRIKADLEEICNNSNSASEAMTQLLNYRVSQARITSLSSFSPVWYTPGREESLADLNPGSVGAFTLSQFSTMFEPHNASDWVELISTIDNLVQVWNTVIEQAVAPDTPQDAIVEAHACVTKVMELKKTILGPAGRENGVPVKVCQQVFGLCLAGCNNSPFSDHDPMAFFQKDPRVTQIMAGERIDALARSARVARAEDEPFRRRDIERHNRAKYVRNGGPWDGPYRDTHRRHDGHRGVSEFERRRRIDQQREQQRRVDRQREDYRDRNRQRNDERRGWSRDDDRNKRRRQAGTNN
jgi:hypothetical protein